MDENRTDPLPESDRIQGLTAELEALRQEKRQRHLLDCARDGLRSRGLDGGFAPFLLGEDEKQTARNIGEFERHFTAALAGEMARRLPQEAPADFSAAAPVRTVRRGIRRI